MDTDVVGLLKRAKVAISNECKPLPGKLQFGQVLFFLHRRNKTSWIINTLAMEGARLNFVVNTLCPNCYDSMFQALKLGYFIFGFLHCS